MCKSLEYATDLLDVVTIIKDEWKKLSNEISIADKKISDIEHYVEISNNLNAAQGYNAYKLLKDVLEERRQIKNQMNEMRPLIGAIQKSNLNCGGALYQSIKDRHRISKNEENDRIYKVKVLTDIFGEIIK